MRSREKIAHEQQDGRWWLNDSAERTLVHVDFQQCPSPETTSPTKFKDPHFSFKGMPTTNYQHSAIFVQFSQSSGNITARKI
jgi:hypothetical protein